MTKIRYFRRGIASVMMTMFLLAGAAISLSACNTTAGAGRDVSAAGHAVTNTAVKAKDGM